MIPPRSLLRDQRGSALLISIVMIVVITILGLALFELGQIEGQQSGASLGDARAFELAQAGMERAIRELSNGFLADPYGSESWVDGPTCTPACETGVYQAMNLANNTLPVAGVNPLTGQDPGGTFTVELKQVTVAEANNPISQGAGYTYPHGQTCIPSTPANPTVCANLMFVRSTGTVAAGFPPGYQAVRTVQAQVKAYSTSYFAGGLTAESASGGSNDPAIDGRVLIAGSAQILGTTTISPAFQIDGGASMGMRNNWSDLWPDVDAAGVRTLARLTPRQAICPTGASCGGGTNLVESLEAELKIYGNVNNTMVQLNGSTDLGINSIQTGSAYGDATINPPNFTGANRFGKGRIDGVYVADGCPFPCTSSRFGFGGGSTIYIDTNNYTKPYPYRPPKLPLKDQLNVAVLYPQADFGTTINGTSYANWYADFMVDHTRTNAGLLGGPVFAPNAVSAGETILIAPAALPVALDNAEFARISNSQANGGYCGDGVLHTTASDYRTLGFLLNILNNLNASATDGNQGFCHTFKFMNKAGAITVGEICWRRNVLSPSNLTARGTANLPPNYVAMPTLEFGSPSCSTPTDPSNPLLINYNGNWKFARNGLDQTYQYRGSAIIYLNQGNLDVEQTLQTTCSVSPTSPPFCGDDGTGRSQFFPENNLLVFITRGSGQVFIANTGGGGTDIVDRFMAYVYAERAVSVRKQTNLIGSLRAQQFCFNNSSGAGCGVAGANGNPRFFQASFQDLRKIPAELPASSGVSGDRWLVNIVPRFWIECRRGPGEVARRGG